MVVLTPAMRCDECQHDAPTDADEILVDLAVAVADRAGDPRQVLLNRTAGTVLEVDAEQSVGGGEQVPRVRLTVEQLLIGTADGHEPSAGLEPLDEELPVRLRQVRRG